MYTDGPWLDRLSKVVSRLETSGVNDDYKASSSVTSRSVCQLASVTWAGVALSEHKV